MKEKSLYDRQHNFSLCPQKKKKLEEKNETPCSFISYMQNIAVHLISYIMNRNGFAAYRGCFKNTQAFFFVLQQFTVQQSGTAGLRYRQAAYHTATRHCMIKVHRH